MKKILGILLSVVLFFLLSSCAGTGTKVKPTITSSDNSGSTNLYFVRQGGFIAGGVLAKIEVNGSEIGKIGVKEFIKYSASANHVINL